MFNNGEKRLLKEREAIQRELDAEARKFDIADAERTIAATNVRHYAILLNDLEAKNVARKLSKKKEWHGSWIRKGKNWVTENINLFNPEKREAKREEHASANAERAQEIEALEVRRENLEQSIAQLRDIGMEGRRRRAQLAGEQDRLVAIFRALEAA